MENNDYKHVELTASEISSLWGSYQADTMMICGINYFLANINDEQIKALLENTLELIKGRNNELVQIFKKEDYPVPQGFTKEDVNLDTPRLFSDRLYLEFLVTMSSYSLAAFSLALSLSERSDIIDYYTNALNDIETLHKKSKELAKEKGIYIRAPHIPKMKQVSFVHDKSFLAGWFHERRPLLGIEISHLVFNAKRNALGQAIITGFSQVAQTKEVRKYFERGRDISGKHLTIFTTILNDNYLSNGSLLATSEVSNSKEAPFSDRLMMFLITTLIASSMGEYGLSMTASPRHDLGTKYTRLIAEIAKFSNEGAKIMIKNGWMEQPPIAADRKELAK